MEDKKKFYDGVISMKRLQVKAKLIEDCSVIFSGLSKRAEVLPKKFKKVAERNILRDYCKGLRIINKKCPVYVELPKIESCGNGMYREIDEKTKEPINDEVHVLTDTYQGQIENDMQKVIDYSSSED